MACFGSRTRRESLFTFSVRVSDALSEERGGRIECVVDGGKGDIRFEWLHEGASALLHLDDSRTVATKVPPGRYEIIAHDASGCSRMIMAVVRLEKLPAIVRYEVTHASSDTARDGCVTAETRHFDDRTVHFLWTTGVVTTTPVLHDVRPGLYSTTPMSADMLPVPCYHACAPARVEASRNAATTNPDFLRVD